MMMFINVISVFLLCTASVYSFTAQAKNASIILHIGPHKTGTTYIQSFFTANADALNQVGYCYPATKVKMFSFLAHDIYHDRADGKYDDIFECLEHGKKVLISSEAFSLASTIEMVQQVKQFFRGYSVFIVSMYRDPMTLLYSVYDQINKASVQSESFAEFIIREYPRIVAHFHYGFLDHYVSAFGRKNVVIVDYDSAVAMNKDVARVILCDIMGVLCGQFLRMAALSNPSVDMVKVDIVRLIQSTALLQGCSIAETFAVPPQLFDQLTPLMIQVPEIQIDPLVIKELAYPIDAEFRRKYGKQMLFNDPDVGREVIAKFSYNVLDEKALLSKESWRTWILEKVREIRSSGGFINCGRLL